eukprot:g24527.t1
MVQTDPVWRVMAGNHYFNIRRFVGADDEKRSQRWRGNQCTTGVKFRKFNLSDQSQPWELLRTAFDFPGMPPKQTADLGLCAACGVGWRAIKSSSGHVSGCAIPEQREGS